VSDHIEHSCSRVLRDRRVPVLLGGDRQRGRARTDQLAGDQGLRICEVSGANFEAVWLRVVGIEAK
jgi:hypothetical protein